ncbi:Protein of unknown function DUF2059 [Granulicella tundricola MP5ACTX9]|uniref:DUF2059 domain-containing protein n=2 Tax=Granulicella TaxID=940557 RepID=E8WWZ8_GRATM|nr:Protein of unknown function DUF2059 [Granulicella tundricola MP5ACTX9]
MKRTAILLSVLLALPFTAHADETSRKAKAQEIVNLLHMDRLMKQMMDGITQQTKAMTAQMAGGTISPAQQAKLDAFQKKVFTLIDAQMGWKAMEPTYIDLYAKTFTEAELDGMVNFYKSPAGISMVDKLPGLTTQAQQLIGQKMVSLQPQLKQLTEDFQKDIASTTPATTKQP